VWGRSISGDDMIGGGLVFGGAFLEDVFDFFYECFGA
jgi:hypothetical protein